MAYDLGQVITLTTTVKVSGALTTPGTIQLLVMKPDGTTSTFTPAVLSLGVYSFDFTPATAGRHAYRFVTTGAGAGATPDVPFEVVAAFGRQDLVSLADVKQQLNITTTTNDDELQAYIDAVTACIEAGCGPMAQRQVTEIIEGFDLTLNLLQVPAISVTSVTSIYTAGVQWLAGVLFVDGDKGVVRRNDRGGFYGGPFTVVYTAGRTSVPAGVGLAARIIVQYLWETQRGTSRRSAPGGQADVQAFAGFSYDIPTRAAALLGPFTSNAGFA